MPTPLDTLYTWRCRHYTSPAAHRCDAGIAYQHVGTFTPDNPNGSPCFAGGPDTCPRRDFPSPTEAALHTIRRSR